VLIDKKYTGFKEYKYLVYSHNNVLLDVEGDFQVKMEIDKEIEKMERFYVFELTKSGEYKKIEYNIEDGHISFIIQSDSSVVFATRNIEYHFIILFASVLLFYLVFIIVYRWKHSRMIVNKKY
jgi:hypothetical protein